MQLAKIKLGQFYSRSLYSRDGSNIKWKAVDKLPAEKTTVGRYWPVAVLEDASGQQVECQARHLTPWDEYLADEQIRKQGCKEMKRKISQLQELIGEGFHVEALGHDAVVIRFSQQAAEASLQLLGAKQPAKGKWPAGDGDWKACTLLGRRLTRAFAAGHTASWMAVYLEGSGYVAQVNFGHQDLDAVLERLSGSDSSSALSSLFS